MILKKTEFYFIRHGETAWNLEGRCMGQKDIPLNDRGIIQARQAGIMLKNTPIKMICHSPLLRAKRTAELINETLNCPMVEIDALKECSWGDFEGELKKNGHHIEHWIQGNTPDGGEDYQTFMARALTGINEALQYSNPLIVSHGGVYWVIQRVLGQPFQTSGPIQNGIAYFHKPLNINDLWYIEPVEDCYHEEPFEI